MTKAQPHSEPKPRKKPGRVPTSCAECRRLKLRCDKKVPCEKCVSRGCGSICPDGSLAAGRGNRLVLANTEELHERIDNLCCRIRQLEKALQELQMTVSTDAHPLLRTDLLDIKTPQYDHVKTSSEVSKDAADAKVPPKKSPAPINGKSKSISSSSPGASSSHSPPSGSTASVDEESFVDAFGTLTIGAEGEANFFGKTARSEYLLRIVNRSTIDAPLILPRLSRRLMDSCYQDDGTHDDNIASEVFSLRPPLSEAVRLCNLYMEHGGYLYYPLPRQQVFDEFLTPIYNCDNFANLAPPYHYMIALLFSIFALASLFDPKSSAYSMTSREYFYIAKAAFGPFTSVTTTPTLACLQAMIHMARYLELSDWESAGCNKRWTYVGSIVRMAQSIGLHLDPDRWKLCDDTSQRRRRVFWQLYAMDAWQSFEFGRPPMINPQFTDCPLPEDTETYLDQKGVLQPSFHSWVWKYTALMHTVMGTVFGSKNPSYGTIFEVDRKIRDFPVPTALQLCSQAVTPLNPTYYMQRWCVLMHKETVLLHLHRAYFAQALQDQPDDLARHRYLPSVMATYRSAWRMIQGLKMVRENAPFISSRVSLCWSHALAGAIAMCILVTRAPTSKMAKPSLLELDTVAQLFEEAAETCKPASNMVKTVKTLQRKAHEAVDGGQHESHITAEQPRSATSATDRSLSPAELYRIGGKTHLISSHESEQQPYTSMSSSSMPPTRWTTSCIHPTITADMRFMDMDTSSTPQNIFEAPSDLDWRTVPLFDLQSMFGMHGGGDGPAAGPDVNMGAPMAGIGQGELYDDWSSLGSGVTPPMLDATWQSFVEQLGF